MKSSGIGGQAVMEGIMMRNGSEYSVAVRKENGEIEVARFFDLSELFSYDKIDTDFIYAEYKK